MTLRRIALSAPLMFPMFASAASKEMLELQREVAQIEDQVRALQSAFDTKMATLATLTQQALDAANKSNTALAALQGGIQEQMRQQGKEVVGPVATVGTKVDQMTTEFTEVRNSMADVTTRLGKLEQQIVDLSNAVRTMQTPAAPPPGASGTSSVNPTSSAAPPISSNDLYANADRDRMGGKSDIALQEYTQYLKYYGETDLAPNAQFWVGDLYFKQGDYQNAEQAFDTVLVKYPANNKTPDAYYMKGMTLVKLGQRNAGAKEFQEVIRRYPHSVAATNSRRELRDLGLSPSTSARRK